MAWDLGEKLVPAGSFRGPHAEKDLRNARCVVLLFYVAYFAGFCFLLTKAFVSGRIEVVQRTYKVDTLEAPSVAVCPFWPDTAIVHPSGPTEEAIAVYKYSPEGEERIAAASHVCRYDRECLCVNLFDAAGGPVLFHDHRQDDVKQIGTTGAASEGDVIFRERIELRTNASDPSKDHTLKVGFYDSVDPRPHFVYMAAGTWMLGKLELETWSVSHLHLADFWAALKRLDPGQIFELRHIFRYTSYDGGARPSASRLHVDDTVGSPAESFVSYSMSNFFVEDQISAESAVSPYTVFFLLALLVMQSTLIGVAKSLFYPEHDPTRDELKVLENSAVAEALNGCCACCCCFPSDREKEPLVGRAP